MSYKIEEEKKFEFSDELFESSGSEIYVVGDYSDFDVQSDQDSDCIKELRDASNFNENEIKAY